MSGFLCKDEVGWTDDRHGDGTDSCSTVHASVAVYGIADPCDIDEMVAAGIHEEFDARAWADELRRGCPETCGLCPGACVFSWRLLQPGRNCNRGVTQKGDVLSLRFIHPDGQDMLHMFLVHVTYAAHQTDICK